MIWPVLCPKALTYGVALRNAAWGTVWYAGPVGESYHRGLALSTIDYPSHPTPFRISLDPLFVTCTFFCLRVAYFECQLNRKEEVSASTLCCLSKSLQNNPCISVLNA